MSSHWEKSKERRSFLPNNLKIESWEKVEPYFTFLLEKEINSADAMENWLEKLSELEAALEEDMAWRYIKMNCDTANKDFENHFNTFVTKIQPQATALSNKLDKKFLGNKHLEALDKTKYLTLVRAKKKADEIFREENIPLFSELQVKAQEYGKISSEMMITYKDKEYTLQQAANFLKETDQPTRKEVYELIQQRRKKDKDKLHQLLSELITKRNQVAKNADFENFRDYKFVSLGRFDYSVEDCYNFHESIKKEATPLAEEIHIARKENLHLNELKPWDLDVDPNLKPPLKPFANSEELIEKTIEVFNRVNPLFGSFITTMKNEGYLDLDSRKGKAPGGFNYPLYESNIPFIYMNSTGNLRDMVTMMHEGGHAVHSFLSKDLPLVDFKSLPSEVAELASMSMELISMQHWDVFFQNAEDLKRAKRIQLEDIISVLSWIATVDKFQHWLYLNPNHTVAERTKYWTSLNKEFGSKIINWTGQEDYKEISWQKQLHIFEVPFYYIEYGMAQLGAISIWKNYLSNPEKTINEYQNALSLGYSKTIPEIYKTAGIEFSFKQNYIAELMQFVKKQLAIL